MGDYSMFMDPIDDIDCKKNFMRDTVSCDLDVNNAVRARIVGKNKGRFLIPTFHSARTSYTAGKMQQKDNLKRCPGH